MSSLDTWLLESINSFSRVSGPFDTFVYFIAGNHLIKGAAILLVFWWLWFLQDVHEQIRREKLISTIFACFVAMAIARALALALPFRPRPIHDESSGFILPYGMSPGTLDGWSSFPSDHAVLFFCLSIGLFFVSRKVGVIAIVYTTILVGLPRVYLGLHYPIDIVAGAIIGGTVAWLCHRPLFISKVSAPVLRWSIKSPQYFYPLLFLVSYQIADMFNNTRDIISYITWLVTKNN